MPKSRQRITFTGFRSPLNGQRGLTLIETLVALGILAAVAVVYLASVSTSSRGVIINQEKVTGESLAKSQMESIRRQAYDGVHNPPVYATITIPQDAASKGYSIVTPITAQRMDPRGDGTANDDGLQKIIVTITHNGKTVFTLEGYKCFAGQ